MLLTVAVPGIGTTESGEAVVDLMAPDNRQKLAVDERGYRD